MQQLPPQNLEAEESVLSSILINNDALKEVSDILEPHDFYRSAHQKIFEAIIALHKDENPIDLVTTSNYLRHHNRLEEVGGATYLARLIDTSPLASNAAEYALIVHDKAVLRKLIEASNKIAKKCWLDDEPDVSRVIIEAQAAIASVSYRDPADDSFYIMRELAETAISRYEQRSADRGKPSGLLTGFHLLDHITTGFQPSDLIILAGRPAMGKSACMMNISRHFGKNDIPHAIFSLEMSRDQLFDRQISSKTGINLQKFRSGRFAQGDWDKITDAAGDLHTMPVYIDDTGALHYSQICRRARKLKEKHDIQAIFVDYLQIMESDKNLNRDREIARITGSMKALAKELYIPVILLSQLNRNLENRSHPHKRPVIADLRDCVPGNTIVSLPDGQRVIIKELENQTPEVLSLRKGKIENAISDKVWKVGRRNVLRVSLKSGRIFEGTKKQKLLLFNGWSPIKNLKKGDRIAILRKIPEPKNTIAWSYLRIALLGQLIGDGSYLKGQPLRYATTSKDNELIVKEAAEKEFGCTVSIDKSKRCHQLIISGNGNRWHPKGVNRWLRDLGIFNQRSYEKRIPKEVYRFKNGQIAELLSHLWASDGHISLINNNYVAMFYTTNSFGLANDIAALLMRFGIVAKIQKKYKKGYKPWYHIMVSGAEQQLKYLKEIPRFGPKIKQGKSVLPKLLAIKSNTNTDTIPREVFDIVRNSMKQKRITHRKMAKLMGTAYKGTAAFNFSPSRKHLKKYAEILENQSLMELAESDLYWDEIKSIEDVGKKDVYDITVPGTNCWIADSIISHNSGNIEQDADVIIFIYRHEQYLTDEEKQNHPDIGIAEFNIAKQRNGPTGMVKLAWRDQSTSFYNFTALDGYG